MRKMEIRGAAAIAALLSTFAVHAAETGTWLGSVWHGAVPYAVRLQLDARGGDLRLGAPRACHIPLLRDGDVYVVGLSVDGGTACDLLSGRRLTVHRDEDSLRVDGVSASTLVLHAAGAATTRAGAAAQTRALGEAGKTGGVRLRVEAASLGERSGEWRQGAPADCHVALQLAAVETGRDWHVFTADSSGGRCDRLIGSVAIVPTEPGSPVIVRDRAGRDIVLAPH